MSIDQTFQELGIPIILKDSISPRGLETLKKVKQFVETECLPRDELYIKEVEARVPAKRWDKIPEVIEPLKAKAKVLGLWNLFLCKNINNNQLYNTLSLGFTNVEYGLMAKYIGKSHIAPEVTNCGAPDTGNMELLIHFGNENQNKKYLADLLDGKIRSAFAMTDKKVASSNALNIYCRADQIDGDFVINGTKWFISGAGDPRCAVWFLLVKTGYNEKSPYTNHSILMVDVKKALKEQPNNVRVVRHMPLFGIDDAPHGHMEINFENFKIPIERDNILGNIGEGFKMIQARLGPGRIHHCMRLLGVAEEALNLSINRANNRMVSNGTRLSDIESFRSALVNNQIDLENMKLLVLSAAFAIDCKGSKKAKKEIAYAKIRVPKKVCDIIDWALQMFGAAGMSDDFPIARYYINSRTLRFADGPDEVHLKQLMKHEAKRFHEIDDYFANIDKFKEEIGNPYKSSTVLPSKL
ncbi:hypothetical protein DASC09_033330 [Saccharomycopsis crataegensis]|uniref:Acyl-CoA dehydrogenase n=1 Tax=Saccharomycopsis crataegensis TaxID=43959 RepID=A0AAV5QMK2_9ASCO|nr:hypothetical protein DASC09_033330 [Saccharomycopsis crataegensis]